MLKRTGDKSGVYFFNIYMKIGKILYKRLEYFVNILVIFWYFLYKKYLVKIYNVFFKIKIILLRLIYVWEYVCVYVYWIFRYFNYKINIFFVFCRLIIF